MTPHRAPRVSHARASLPRTLAAALLLTIPTVQALAAAQGSFADWSPELLPALRCYERGEYQDARERGREIAGFSPDERARRDAELLEALVLMRSASRTERLSGRGLLGPIGLASPGIVQRPEVQAALGIALTREQETAAALHQLMAAEAEFARRADHAGRTDALLALAAAWVAHTEWQLPASEMLGVRARTPAEADAVRRQKLTAIRSTLEALPGAAEAIPKLDLIEAGYLVSTPAGKSEGRALLARLAENAELTTTVGEACLLLADELEAEGRPGEALALLERVERGGGIAFESIASDRADRIRLPQLELELPVSAEPGVPAPIGLRARNLASIQIEARAVDVVAWMQSRQGRMAESALPISGSVSFAREYDLRSVESLRWWSDADQPARTALALPAGAYVILGVGRTHDGQAIEARRLLLVSTLRATIVTGREAAIANVLSGDRAIDPARRVTLQFWMHGAFVPRRFEFTGPLHRFDLPGEARVIRDGRWTCLVECDGQLTICRGELSPQARSAHALIPFAAITAPSALAPGELTQTTGLLLEPPGRTSPRRPQSVTVELQDANGRTVASESAAVGACGAFATSVRVPPRAQPGGYALRFRAEDHPLEAVFGRIGLSVERPDRSPVNVSSALPPHVPLGTASLLGDVRVGFPWDAPTPTARVDLLYRALVLPSGDGPGAIGRVLPRSEDLSTDGTGRARVVRPLADFDAPDGPLAIGAWITARGPDARAVSSLSETLVANDPVHAWLNWSPHSPRVDDAVHLAPGWFDPQRLRLGRLPTLEIAAEGEPFQPIALAATWDGLTSQTWRPRKPGKHRARLTQALAGRAPLVVEKTIDVAGQRADGVWLERSVGADAGDSPASAAASSIRLRGAVKNPTLLLLAHSDPIDARIVLPRDADSAFALPDPHDADPRGNVLAIELGPESIRVVDSIPATPGDGTSPALAIRAVEPAAAHADGLEFEVSRSDELGRAPMDVLLRLTQLGESASFSWLPGEMRWAYEDAPGPLRLHDSRAVAGGDAEPAAHAIPPPPPLSGAEMNALYSGATLWTGVLPAGQSRIRIPVHRHFGLLLVSAVGRSADGRLCSGRAVVDRSAAPQVRIDAPSRLTLGDRALIAVTLTNRAPGELRAIPTIEFSPGLALAWCEESSAGVVSPRSETPPGFVVVPAGGSVTLRLLVEADAVGDATVRVATPGDDPPVAPQQRTIRVTPADIPLGAPDVTVRRTLYRLARVEPELRAAELEGAPPVESAAELRWVRQLLADGESVEPCETLLIVDEFELAAPLEATRWRQALPPTCVTYGGSDRSVRQIATPYERAIDELTFAAPRLAAGAWIHETMLVAVRPGSAVVPPPEISAGGRSLRVHVEPSSPTVVVR